MNYKKLTKELIKELRFQKDLVNVLEERLKRLKESKEKSLSLAYDEIRQLEREKWDYAERLWNLEKRR